MTSNPSNLSTAGLFLTQETDRQRLSFYGVARLPCNVSCMLSVLTSYYSMHREHNMLNTYPETDNFHQKQLCHCHLRLPTR